MALWIADSEQNLTCDAQKLCRGAQCLTICGDSVICAAQDGAHAYAAGGREICAYPLPPGVCRLCALPGALYALSGEADSVSVMCPHTGRLRLCARAGCYPRDMELSPCGRFLLIAGGASGEALVYSAQELTLLKRYPLPGVVCAAAFGTREMYALCAVEEGDVAAQLLRISSRGVTGEIFHARALPGALRTLPDGTLLCGILGETMRLRPDGRVLQRYLGGLAQSIRVLKSCALIADPVDGSVQRVLFGIGKSAESIAHGASPSDALVF